MKASEADKYKTAPKLADIAVGEPGGEGEGHEHGGHRHSMESIRTATHCGHEIVIKTCYEITVDGKSIASHLSVDDDGSVHTHALPEYAFTSAVDVVKKIIEAFPSEFPCDDDEPGHDPGGGGHGHDEAGHDHGHTGSSSGQQGHGHGGHT
jgi:hypothetical protein